MIAPMHGASLAETTAFVTVVELKSFTKAAKQLVLSPPRVSEMIRNLEERQVIFFWAPLFCVFSHNTLKFLWTCPSTRL
jgi:regulatory helix-turn-helix LysR family protein